MNSSRKPPDPEFVMRTKSGSVTCISDGGVWGSSHVIFVGSSDGTMSIWDLESKRPIKVFSGDSKKNILQLRRIWGSKILSHDRDGGIVIWNLNESDAVKESEFTVYQYGFCPADIIGQDDETLIAYPSNADSQLEVINLKDKNIICQVKPAEKLGMLMQVKLFRDEQTKQLFSIIGYEDGTVALWDLGKCKIKSRIKAHTEAVMCMDIDSKCSKAVVGSADNRIIQIAISAAPDEEMKIIKELEIKSQGLSSLRVRNDCKIVAAGCWDGRIRIFGWKKLKPLAILQFHSETINCIEFTRENRLVCGSKDGKISIWNIYNET